MKLPEALARVERLIEDDFLAVRSGVPGWQERRDNAAALRAILSEVQRLREALTDVRAFLWLQPMRPVGVGACLWADARDATGVQGLVSGPARRLTGDTMTRDAMIEQLKQARYLLNERYGTIPGLQRLDAVLAALAAPAQAEPAAPSVRRNSDDTAWLIEHRQGDQFVDVDLFDDGDVIVSRGGKDVPPRSWQAPASSPAAPDVDHFVDANKLVKNTSPQQFDSAGYPRKGEP